MTNPLIAKLERSGLLQQEDHAVLSALCDTSRTADAGTVLVQQGEHVPGVYLVLKGFAYRYALLPDGRRQILGLLLPGDFCDLQAALLKRVDHFTATLTHCVVVFLPRDIVDELTLSHSRIAKALWWTTLVDESIIRMWLTKMGQCNAEVCLAQFVCETFHRLQVVGQVDANSFALPLTQEQLGDILGITSVHVNRTLRQLRDANLLDIKSGRASVPDLVRLQTFCGFDPRYLHLEGDQSTASDNK